MEKFTASNGLTVSVEPDDDMFIGGVPGVSSKVGLVGLVTKALREFFVHERDQELGRWRWPDDTRYVVYSTADPDEFRVTDEHTGNRVLIRRSNLSPEGSDKHFGGAARAYFAAHPEPKPWHGAVDGQLWLIRFDDFPNTKVAALVKSGRFVYNDHCHEGVAELNDPTIVGAKRVWPEVSDG